MNDVSDREKIFRTQIGSKATVQRETMGADKAATRNRLLAELGLSFPEVVSHLKHYKYMGSAAVHIYWNETLQQIDFVSQTQPLELYRCPEPLAAKAFDDLLQTMKVMYGHKRGRLRSGF